MSFDMEPYSVAKELEDGYDGTRLRVRFKGDLIGFASTYAEAYDIMEEHANSPCVSTEVSADMADMEQQIIDLAQEVDYMEAERDYWKELSGDATKAVDAERKRSWEENKQFQWELAEQNAELRKQLGEKHDDNCRLQRQLAEQHNKLREAYAQCVYGTCHDDLEESTLSAQVRMSNAEVKVDDLTEENAILRRQVERYEDDVYKRQHDMYANSK